MFARTPRLLLRPGFAEDAPALAAGIADHGIVRHLASAPWPYRMRDAEAFLAAPRDPILPSLLIFERTGGRAAAGRRLRAWPAAVGRGRARLLDRARPLGPRPRHRGSLALVDIARTLRLKWLEGAHFTDNPASGRVLEKLGFEDSGIIAPRFSCARGHDYPSRLMRLDLAAAGSGVESPEIQSSMAA